MTPDDLNPAPDDGTGYERRDAKPETRSSRALELAKRYADKALDAAENGKEAYALYAEAAVKLNELAALAKCWETTERNTAVLNRV